MDVDFKVMLLTVNTSGRYAWRRTTASLGKVEDNRGSDLLHRSSSDGADRHLKPVSIALNFVRSDNLSNKVLVHVILYTG